MLLLVGGGGIFVGRWAATPLPTPTPVVATPTDAADPMANWQTYVNPTCGVQVAYPQNWTKTVCPEGVDCLNSSDFTGDQVVPADYATTGYSLEIRCETGNSKTTEQLLASCAQAKPGETCKATQLGKIPAAEYDHNVYVAGFNNQTLTVIPLWQGTSPNSPEIIKQILSTFKFTTPSTTCIPRPKCLDSVPRCMIAETSDMCPKGL